MTPTLLLGLFVLLLLVLAALGVVGARRQSTDPDGGFAVSTEGMKVCPRCGMGNLWTSRQCAACGNGLKG